MSDIFLSYAREDREIAEDLATALSGRGWSVWWDRQVVIGRPFDAEIEHALAEARCVIVLWSRASVSSEWVKIEASEAWKRRILLPALIEDVTPPLEFRRLQTARLHGPSDVAREGFERLVQDITRLVTEPSRPAPAQRPLSRRAVGPALLIAPTLIAVLLGWTLSIWRVPTPVRLALTVARAQFTLAADDPPLVRIVDAIPFTAVGIERFTTISFEPSTIETADSARYRLPEDQVPESAWMKLTRTHAAVEFRARENVRLPAVTLERVEPRAGVLGTVGPIAVPLPSTVAFELAGETSPTVTVHLEHREPTIRLPVWGLVQVTSAHTFVTGLTAAADARDQTRIWRLALPEASAPVQIKGERDRLVISITLSAPRVGQPVTLFSGGTVPIDAVDFTRQAEFGRRVSTVVAEGRLSRPDQPDARPWTVHSTDVVAVDQLRHFHIHRIAMEPGRPGMQVELEGTAGRVTTGRGEAITDHRRSALEVVIRDPRWLGLGLLGWMVATGTAAYRLFARRTALKEVSA